MAVKITISIDAVTEQSIKALAQKRKMTVSGLIREFVRTASKKEKIDIAESNFHDIEDAYQYYTALQIRGIKYFITRNIKHYKIKHYKHSVISVVTPGAFLSATQEK